MQRTLDEGPRIVMRSGAELVVVVAAADEYRRSQQARPDFKEFLMSGSDFEQLDLTRSSELPREIDFGDA